MSWIVRRGILTLGSVTCYSRIIHMNHLSIHIDCNDMVTVLHLISIQSSQEGISL